jgi:hypothetical protein
MPVTVEHLDKLGGFVNHATRDACAVDAQDYLGNDVVTRVSYGRYCRAPDVDGEPVKTLPTLMGYNVESFGEVSESLLHELTENAMCAYTLMVMYQMARTVRRRVDKVTDISGIFNANEASDSVRRVRWLKLRGNEVIEARETINYKRHDVWTDDSAMRCIRGEPQPSSRLERQRTPHGCINMMDYVSSCEV